MQSHLYRKLSNNLGLSLIKLRVGSISRYWLKSNECSSEPNLISGLDKNLSCQPCAMHGRKKCQAEKRQSLPAAQVFVSSFPLGGPHNKSGTQHTASLCGQSVRTHPACKDISTKNAPQQNLNTARCPVCVVILSRRPSQENLNTSHYQSVLVCQRARRGVSAGKYSINTNAKNKKIKKTRKPYMYLKTESKLNSTRRTAQ